MSVCKYAFLFVGLSLATYVTGWLLRDPISSAAFLALTIFTYWKAYEAPQSNRRGEGGCVMSERIFTLDDLRRYHDALRTGDPDRQLCNPEDDVALVAWALAEVEQLRHQHKRDLAEYNRVAATLNWLVGRLKWLMADRPADGGVPVKLLEAAIAEARGEGDE